ncbi:MAG: c-type cytochrome [Acidimicrobiales bacterium]
MRRLLAALARLDRPRLLRRLAVGPAAVLGVGLMAFGLFFGLGAASSATTPIVSTNPNVIANGQALFDVHCSSCHGIAGVGSSRAPRLIHVGAAAADFYLITGRMPLNDAADQPMQHTPFFGKLQIQALVSYIAALPYIDHQASLLGPGIPSILPLCKTATSATATNPDCVTLSFGQETFALNCSQCHQISGAGGMLSKGMVVPSLKNATNLEVAEAIRVGPRPMPGFGPGALNERQLSAVVNYVAYLRHPDSNGGLAISNFGPVAEGFVGILFGLGVLLFVARMMGTRA